MATQVDETRRTGRRAQPVVKIGSKALPARCHPPGLAVTPQNPHAHQAGRKALRFCVIRNNCIDFAAEQQMRQPTVVVNRPERSRRKAQPCQPLEMTAAIDGEPKSFVVARRRSGPPPQIEPRLSTA